jgi:hypothetical protein
VKRGREALFIFLATALTYVVGVLIGSRWLLPMLNAAPAYSNLVRHLRLGERRAALESMLVWAASLAVCATVVFAVLPKDPAPLVLHGAAYRDEMFAWIRTGVGAEGTPRLFLPQHIQHLAAFLALALLTASAAAIVMGAVLMNYMAYYVASLARAGVPTWAVVLLGWQPWAIVRIAAFCAFGVVCAEPLLRVVLGRSYVRVGSARPIVIAASVGILADWALKAALASQWGLSLRHLLP